MPASSSNSEAPKIATYPQLYLNAPNINYLGSDIQMSEHLCTQVKHYTFVPYEGFFPFYKATEVKLLES